MTKIADTACILPNTILGKNVRIEDHCVIGLPFKGMKAEQTIIGDNSLIRAGTYIYSGTITGANFQTGNKANIRELNTIGENVSIGTLTVIEHHVIIGNDVRIHSQAFVPEHTILEAGSWLGPNVVITNAKYPKHPSAKETLAGVHVMQNAKIGANATLLPGITVGKNVLIGAGSVVTTDIEDDMVAIGVPAKVIHKVQY